MFPEKVKWKSIVAIGFYDLKRFLEKKLKNSDYNQKFLKKGSPTDLGTLEPENWIQFER
jgi:hypothetical protein